ncbi:hypothetical protein M413DRAFT_32878 [Hebeloma cylindrosporum]|uniref:Uncharacterized protein n=1 Tax=Hebeloma cylindrosporum TaxID=76867 RepID=A0A0C2Y1I8_HEBCY|nr:hypothetical protein M413DRAFT_32878 [Hebeloma cylindrosporum h7]
MVATRSTSGCVRRPPTYTTIYPPSYNVSEACYSAEEYAVDFPWNEYTPCRTHPVYLTAANAGIAGSHSHLALLLQMTRIFPFEGVWNRQKDYPLHELVRIGDVY